MKVIIAGSRFYDDYSYVTKVIKDSGFNITEVVSGGATGVDRLGERYAQENKFMLKLFPADWAKHGKAAGPIRNQKMAEYAEALIAIRINNSRGTTDMINRATKMGLKVHVEEIGR